MIKIEKTDVYGWEPAIRGMRNPLNSWAKSDSSASTIVRISGDYVEDFLGPNDLDLMKRLIAAGSDHRKFMRMIVVWADIIGPWYFWKEFSTYKIGTVANSCSTMHKIHSEEITMDDFSTDHLNECNRNILTQIIRNLNLARRAFIKGKDKEDWWQMIQLLPSSYNQKRTVMLNYEVLRNMYHARKNHKLDEWHTFCEWIESLPYGELITGESK